MKKAIMAAALLGIAGLATAEGQIVEVDISGFNTWDSAGSANNESLTVDLASAIGLPAGTPVSMTGVGWDVLLAVSQNGSWYSEATIGFGDNVGDNAISLAPGAADGFNGPDPIAYSSPVLKFDDLGIPNIELTDGVLGIEFFESFDDAADEIDGTFLEGTLFIQVVPAPGAMALLGLAGVAARRRRRG